MGADWAEMLTWHELHNGVGGRGASCERQMGQSVWGQRSERDFSPTQMPAQTQHTCFYEKLVPGIQAKHFNFKVLEFFFSFLNPRKEA